MPEQWANVRPVLRAIIGNFEFFDIIQFSANFALQSIPTCSLQVAVGRRVDNQKAATIHSAVTSLSQEVLAQVYMTVIPLGSSPGDAEPWPANEFLIFEGNVIGTGWTRTQGSAGFVIHILHWLAALNYSSSLSASSHPANPYDFTVDAVGGGANINDPNAPATGAGDLAWQPMCHAQGEISAASLQNDLWGDAIQPFMIDTANQNRINSANNAGAAVAPNAPTLNSAALAALNRIAPVVTNKWYVPLALNNKGADITAISNGISQALRNQTYKSWYSQTLWGKLVGEFAPSFFFAVVPRVNDALIIPYAPGLQSTFTTILGTQYDYCNINGQSPHSLRAVGILHGVRFSTNFNLSPAGAPFNQPGVAGWFEPGENGDGLIMLRDAPSWLSDAASAYVYPVGTTGTDGNVIGTSWNPGSGKQSKQTQPGTKMASYTGPDNILSAYAQQWFVLEMLKGKQGELSGKLRFDIAPGSTIALQTVGDRFLGNLDSLADTLFATVLQATIVVNSEARRAGTSFSLGHIRNTAENQDPRTSIKGPPFFAMPFPGATLIDFQ